MTPTIYVVTPSFNAAETIDRTIASVLSQAGDFRIRYHIQDGGSTDGTMELIEAWTRRLRDGSFPRHCQGIRFTYSSGADSGMYDALVRGFEEVEAQTNSFMTWINADDILMQGALALASNMERQFTPAQLSWFGGAVCIIRDDIVTVSFDRHVPREALRLGLCDGSHWDYLQQEGTFFRKWLWAAVEPSKTIAPMKLAGDWNLWRLMATQSSLAQTTIPLGGFRITDGQMSATQRDSYLAEVDQIIPNTARRASFKSFCTEAPITRRRLKAAKGSTFVILEETADNFARHRWQMVFGQTAVWDKRSNLPEKVISEGKTIVPARVGTKTRDFADIDTLVKASPGLIALDADWQFPAITEQHAYHRMLSGQTSLPSGMLYVAFPWATLIDKLQNKAKDRDFHLDRFEQFCARLPIQIRKTTVCQHIYGRRYVDLFRKAGIQDVFWSHATQDDFSRAHTDEPGPRFIPFPLFPVQVQKTLPEAAPEADVALRPHLFSFIGARANKYYLTAARNWILDLLSDDKRGLIIGRDNWHYQKVVYDLQVNERSDKGDEKTLVDVSASDQFRESLLQSTFSLCPAGSGPNSIRLWESLGTGSIPVILADTWAPPGDRRIWEMAAVFCKETPEDIKALPGRLAAIAATPGRLAQMRHAMRQLWLLYGPDSFVTDVQEFLLSHHTLPQPDRPRGDDPLSIALIRGEGRNLLLVCACALLLDPAVTQARIANDAALAEALRKARADLPTDSALVLHYDAVCSYVAPAATQPLRPASPRVQRSVVPKICFLGRHAKRTPLSYAPIRRLVGDRLETVDRPEQADVLVTGFNLDLRENIETLRPLMQATKPPRIAVLSEEPLWDITWSGPFTGRDGSLAVKDISVPYTFLGHETSDIYEFDRIPYFVLTSETYAVRYSNMMMRFAQVSPSAMLKQWSQAPITAAFFAEHRKDAAYSRVFPERDVAALSVYRTELAEGAKGGGVLRVGKGWGADMLRQDLPDWHLDKLAQLDGRTRVLSSVENVHQRLYISEKIFDAFAVGAIPAYWAAPKHRIFDLVPETSMLNCYALDPQAAAERISGIRPDGPFAESWLQTCSQLAKLFGNAQVIQSERRRVAEAVLNAVLLVV